VSRSSPFILMAWALWWASVAGAAEPGAAADVRRVELREAMQTAPEVHIGPGLSTTVLFDAPIRPEELVLDGRERFLRVGMSEDHLVLIPSSTFRPGERFRLEVRFRDGATPERAALMLVVDDTRVERQVEVYRRPRTAESYRQEVEALKSQLARLQLEVARQHVPDAPAAGGASLWKSLANWEGIESEPMTYKRAASTAPVSVKELRWFRLVGAWQVVRVSLASKGEPRVWMATGASLRDAQGQVVKVLPPWGQGVVTPTGLQSVLLVIEEGAALDAGSYTLKVWNEGTGQSVTVEGCQVP
jgi:uncharacterized protein (TIGR02268 family)